MSKTLTTNVTNGKGGQSEPVYLVYMDLGSSTILRLSTKATSEITGWSGDAFSGGYLEELGIIDMEVDLSNGPNIHNTYDFEFSVLNQDNYHNYFLGYNFYNRPVEIRMIFADQSSPSWTNAVKCFKGIIYDWWYDKNRITFKCTSNDKKWFVDDLPKNTFQKEDFPLCDDAIIGQRRPLLWGSYSAPNEYTNAGGDFVKAFLVDKSFATYLCADHEITGPIMPLYWYSALNQICRMAAGTSYIDWSNSSVVVSGLEYVSLVTKTVNIVSRIDKVLQSSRGNDFPDAYKVMDYDSDTYVTMSGDTGEDELLLLMKDIPAIDCYIFLWLECDFSGTVSADNLRVEVYADDFTDFLSGEDVTADKALGSLKDIEAAWDAASGKNMGLWLTYNDNGDGLSVNVKECFVRFTGNYIDEFPAIMYASLDGMLFGSWIDTGQRDNGYDEDDVITPGSYVIESILHYLGLSDDDFNYDSWDAAGNTTNGTRKDWLLAGQLNDQISCRNLLKQMMLEHASMLFEGCDGTARLKPINLSESSGGTITGSSIMIDSESNESTLKRTLTPLDNIYNNFEVHYKYNYATGNYDEMLYCDRNGKSTGISSGYDTKCSTSYTKYSTEKKLVFQAKWIRDSATAIELIEFLVDWHANRREIVEFDTGLGSVDLEIGDVRVINNSFVNDTYMLVGIKHDCEKDVIHLKWIEL